MVLGTRRYDAKRAKRATDTTMEHAKSDEKGGVGFEKDVQEFTDNAEGTISLKEFLEQVGRCGERVAGNTIR